MASLPGSKFNFQGKWKGGISYFPSAPVQTHLRSQAMLVDIMYVRLSMPNIFSVYSDLGKGWGFFFCGYHIYRDAQTHYS